MPRPLKFADSAPAAVERAAGELGQRVRLARVRRRLSQRQLASRAGISYVTQRAVEAGSLLTGLGAYLAAIWALGLEREFQALLDPFELPLRDGRFETVKLSGIFGALRDASPEAWGRRIIERHLRRTDLSEIEYLLHSPGDRVGARSFGRGKTPPPPTPRFNEVLDLAKLVEFAQAVERDENVELPPQIGELIQPGTSVGGARHEERGRDGRRPMDSEVSGARGPLEQRSRAGPPC